MNLSNFINIRQKINVLVLLGGMIMAGQAVFAQKTTGRPAPSGYISKVWSADQGNGTYKNPVLNADYSDPDVIRVGSDFYLVSSSFEDIPGLPILHSKDLVNWKIIGHALLKQPPFEHFSVPRHGDGVWAPAIRFYKGDFCIYYPDPDHGIYLVKAKDPAGPWSAPVLVMAGKGIIDPCPLLDDDGQMYLVHAFAGSRAGIKSVIAINKLNKEGTRVTDDGVIVYDGHETDPTIEGPKFYKRNGYYYIFAPAGGVPTGWQLVLRSRNLYGPYERKVVMDQGKSTTNGPHQGAWVNTTTGEDWFMHFQDKEAYGRVVHLQPMTWKNDWPVIGIDKDGDGKGEPVLTYKKPNVGKVYPVNTPVESDEFNTTTLGMQWQWQANPKPTWLYLNAAKGTLRLYSDQWPEGAPNLWRAPNVLLQKFMADEFTVTVKLTFTPNPKVENEKAGLTIMGFSYANIAVKSKKDGQYLVYTLCQDAEKGKTEQETVITELESKVPVYLRVVVQAGGKCRFSYSTDGNSFKEVVDVFTAEVGRWKGAKVGLFCTREGRTNDSGYADVDWFRVTANK
ncbi:glycoside hydrolase 43 family protein [Mucilaginibacter daejeonensis]|nr:glycoside hydrolase 43 family protein [Mucilaginibacter daejeonensis]